MAIMMVGALNKKNTVIKKISLMLVATDINSSANILDHFLNNSDLNIPHHITKV